MQFILLISNFTDKINPTLTTWYTFKGDKSKLFSTAIIFINSLFILEFVFVESSQTVTQMQPDTSRRHKWQIETITLIYHHIVPF